MTNAAEPFGVGVIGCSAASRFFCERLSLRTDLSLVARWVDLERTVDERWQLTGVTSPQSVQYLMPFDVMKAPEPRLVYFAAGSPLDWMIEALARAKSILVEDPQSLTVEELQRLAKIARDCHQVAAIYEPRRWDGDFLLAQSALKSGRLGELRRLRYTVHDKCLPNETFSRGVARELGTPVLDQLLQLIETSGLTTSTATAPIAWRHFPSAHDHSEGFVASFEFAENISAIIEIQTRSLLGFRSGWMIEGTDGAYRNGRLYTRTADGEIVDEPLPPPPTSRDPFLDALVSSLRGRASDLPTVRDAVRVATLLSDTP